MNAKSAIRNPQSERGGLAAAFLVCLVVILPATSFGADAPTGKGRQHWAFQPVRDPALPTVRDSAWVRTPIDAYILAKLEAAQLRPAPPAESRALLRRIYLDLIGLPPTPEEQQAFERAATTNRQAALEEVVDRLLARPEYGERWARHWLDVVRYAESNGYERDGAKPNAWRYRDYVIDAFNKDKPYDRFVLEQIAGDELPDANAESHIATTFLRLGTWDDEPAEPMMDRYDQLDDVLGVTATTFLAQTLRCARCHDHKFEPFSQKDYYRMLAVFEPLKRPQNGRADLDRPVGSKAEMAVIEKVQTRLDADKAVVQKHLDDLALAIRERLFTAALKKERPEGEKATTLPAEAIAAFRSAMGKRTREQKDLVKKHSAQLEREINAAYTPAEKQQRTELEQSWNALQKEKLPDLPRAYIWYEEGPKAQPTHVFKRGNPVNPTEEVGPGLPKVLDRVNLPAPAPTPQSTGRRLWLAHWLTQPDNPLTARVMVNRVWHYHFGRGLVGTPNDFGVMGETSSNPELLDYLAGRFLADGWKLKSLHRLIVLSSAYQTSSQLDGGSVRGDKRLTLFGRWRQRRIEAEAFRDSVLAISGQLNPERGGPSIYPTLPRAVLEGQSRPGEGWGKSDARQASRRSIYIFAKRALRMPELDLLDAPDTTSTCEVRPTSTTAPQALTLLNGAFLQEQAGHFAARLQREAGNDSARQVRLGYTLALARPPSAEEMRLATAFLQKQRELIDKEPPNAQQVGDAKQRALAAFCLVLFNTNEFAYPG
jgi:hypothetical protein